MNGSISQPTHMKSAQSSLAKLWLIIVIFRRKKQATLHMLEHWPLV